MTTTSNYTPTDLPSTNGHVAAAANVATATRTLPVLPDSVLRPGRATLRSWLRRLVVLVGLAAVAAAMVAVVDRRRNEDDTMLPTATTGAAEITSSYTSVATIEPVDQATVGFPTGGTVATVAVAAGDTVAVGDLLATLDTADLEQALRSAQADLADAQNVLATALAGDDPSSLLGGAGGAGAFGVSLADAQVVFEYASARVDDATYVLASVSDGDVAAAQQAVVAAQSAVTEATNAAAAALDSAVAVCAAVQTDITPYIDPGTGVASYPTDTIVACRSALDAAMAAQQTVSSRQAELTGAATALDALLDQRAGELAEADAEAGGTPEVTMTTPSEQPATTLPESAPATTVPADAGSGSGGFGGGSGGLPSGSTGGAGGSGGVIAVEDYEPTAEELISYQSSVDAARYAVAAAEQAIAQATIVSPIAGTVTSVGFAAGDTVSAADAAVVVQGDGGMEATTTVSIDDIEQIEVGQAVTVSPDGSATTLAGKVVAIGITPDSAASTTSYRVTIGLDGDTSALRNGNLGDAEITVATTSAATAVPTSAVKLDARGNYVTVVASDGATSRQNVEVGVVGAQWTEITSGLDAGQTVALTDPTAVAGDDASVGTGNRNVGGFTPPDGVDFGSFDRGALQP